MSRVEERPALPPAPAAPDPARAARFRPDIEGMRAVAVGLVLLYHAGVPLFGGGYVGVDVFFVISGFLITGLLLREAERTGRVSILGFYARRIRRLLPAATVVLIVVAVLAWLAFNPVRRQSVAGDEAAASLYVINWRLAGQSVDYLAANAPPSPVQHYWSLAVEEQFYVVWPLLILLITLAISRRRDLLRPVLFTVVAAITLGSLVYGVWLTGDAPGRAYFSSLTRAWELGLGAALALTVPALRRIPLAAGRVLGWVGLAVVVASGIVISASTPFPGTAALLPTLGVAAVIAAGCRAESAPGILGTRPMTWMGGVSYPWYLWHWPVVVFATAHWGPIDWLPLLGLVLLSVLPALVAQHFVEDPIRHSQVLARLPWRAIGIGVLCMALSLGAAFWLRSSVHASPPPADAVGAGALSTPQPSAAPSGSAPADPTPAPTPPADYLVKPAAIAPDPVEAADDIPAAYDDGCHVPVQVNEVTHCVYGDPAGAQTVVLFGDSHALQWLPAVEQLGEEDGWRVVLETRSSCNPADVTPYSPLLERSFTECPGWREQALQIIEEEQPDLVLLGGMWNTPVAAENGQQADPRTTAQATVDGLRRTLERLSALGVPLVVLRDTPRAVADPPACVSGVTTDLTECARPKRQAEAQTRRQIEERAIEGVPLASLVDLNPEICPYDPCSPVIGKVLVNRDDHHLTATYARTLTPVLEARLAALSVLPLG